MNRNHLTTIDSGVAIVVKSKSVVANVGDCTTIDSSLSASLYADRCSVIVARSWVIAILVRCLDNTAIHCELSAIVAYYCVATVVVASIDSSTIKGKLAIVVDTTSLNLALTLEGQSTLDVESILVSIG